MFFKKKNNDEIFIRERIAEMEIFLNDLEKNQNIFNCEPFWIFFDFKKKESDVGTELDSFLKPETIFILENYENIFPKFFEKEENHLQLDDFSKFEKKIKMNIKFYKVI